MRDNLKTALLVAAFITIIATAPAQAGWLDWVGASDANTSSPHVDLQPDPSNGPVRVEMRVKFIDGPHAGTEISGFDICDFRATKEHFCDVTLKLTDDFFPTQWDRWSDQLKIRITQWPDAKDMVKVTYMSNQNMAYSLINKSKGVNIKYQNLWSGENEFLLDVNTCCLDDSSEAKFKGIYKLAILSFKFTPDDRE